MELSNNIKCPVFLVLFSNTHHWHANHTHLMYTNLAIQENGDFYEIIQLGKSETSLELLVSLYFAIKLYFCLSDLQPLLVPVTLKTSINYVYIFTSDDT